MGHKNRHVWALLTAIVLAGCTSAPDPRAPLDATMSVGTMIPVEKHENNLIYLDVMVNGTGPHRFLLDTGATITAIFPSFAESLGVSDTSISTKRVRGIVGIDERPQVHLDEFRVAGVNRNDVPVVILAKDDTVANAQGILGMDILNDYVIVFDVQESTLNFIPNGEFPADAFGSWATIALDQTPYNSDDFGLHFGRMLIDNHRIPALIDLGSSVSVLNWEAASYRSGLRSLRRRLREAWEINGSVGTFRPTVAVNLFNVRIGYFAWEEAQFVVLDLSSLGILGSDGKPLVIAGADLFTDHSFAFDFKNDVFYLSPEGLTGNVLEPQTAIERATRFIGADIAPPSGGIVNER